MARPLTIRVRVRDQGSGEYTDQYRDCGASWFLMDPDRFRQAVAEIIGVVKFRAGSRTSFRLSFRRKGQQPRLARSRQGVVIFRAGSRMRARLRIERQDRAVARRRREDMAKWLAARVVIDPGCSAEFSTLLEDATAWHAERGLNPPLRRTLALALKPIIAGRRYLRYRYKDEAGNSRQCRSLIMVGVRLRSDD